MGVKPNQFSAEQFVSFHEVAKRSIVGIDQCSQFSAINSDSDSEDVIRGEQDARLLSSIMLSSHYLDHESSLITEAIELATYINQVSEHLDNIILFDIGKSVEESRNQGALFWALQTLTLGRHYEENTDLRFKVTVNFFNRLSWKLTGKDFLITTSRGPYALFYQLSLFPLYICF